ncbi:hypothetical protein B0H17DRAFT_145987 [Mycena rosella]|uniref:Uncharacterized protein n=1 Tax=Mycena rosella TaxID=1033263 RepID=A0AAD7DZ72_MYCRO|nr:hypothetical protein B0H17DRAFT_145987 [Mycena rosella]
MSSRETQDPMSLKASKFADLLSKTAVEAAEPSTDLHDALWKRPLDQYIETVSASRFKQLAGPSQDVMEVDEDEDESQGEQIAYIDLQKAPALKRIFAPEYCKPIFIVRQEYMEAMEHVLTAAENVGDLGPPWNTRHIVTGQPGIGKSLGSYYFLFRLLSSGTATFYINETDNVATYYHEGGVSTLNPAECRLFPEKIREAAWVLVDIPRTPNWAPPFLATKGYNVIITASPSQPRMRNAIIGAQAVEWYMKPWTMAEISALMELNGEDLARTRDALKTHGLVPRALFGERPNAQKIKQAISVAATRNYFLEGGAFTLETAAGDPDITHQVYLVGPQVLQDGTFDRRAYTAQFLTADIATLLGAALDQRNQSFVVSLARAFNTVPQTRSAAGVIVEGMFHTALTQPAAGEEVINCSTVCSFHRITRSLTMFGTADRFFLESHRREDLRDRPLYLRPNSQTFACVDALLLTQDSVLHIQSSLSDRHVLILLTISTIIKCLNKHFPGSSGLLQVYCLLGIDMAKVQKLVNSAHGQLDVAKKAVTNRSTAPAGTETPAMFQDDFRSIPTAELHWLKGMTVHGIVYDPVSRMLTKVTPMKKR